VSSFQNHIPRLFLAILTFTPSIVFIHGLNGDLEDSWTASNEHFWPRDFLPDDIPNSRIITWGYDARVVAWKSLQTVSNRTIPQYASSLCTDLSRLRPRSDATKYSVCPQPYCNEFEYYLVTDTAL